MWVPIALSSDVPAGVTRAVILDGAEYVVWRGAGGTAQVWEDRCPHRGMRLSFGFVRGDALNCLYHGWEYGAGASCRRIPAHPDLIVPPSIKARAFAVAEGGGMIWTRIEGEDAMPELPQAEPVASLAIDAGPETVMALCAAEPQGAAQIFATELDGIAFYLGWHSVSAGKIMLHATSPSDDPGALSALRALRDRAEMRQAA